MCYHALRPSLHCLHLHAAPLAFGDICLGGSRWERWRVINYMSDFDDKFLNKTKNKGNVKIIKKV